jgi:hypothetical protein
MARKLMTHLKGLWFGQWGYGWGHYEGKPQFGVTVDFYDCYHVTAHFLGGWATVSYFPES